MPLQREQRKQLQAALLSAFDNDGLHRLVRLELGSDLELFTTGGDRTQHVFELIAWAERTDRIAELVCGAYNQNPTNVDLQRLTRAAQSWPACSARGMTIWEGEACVFAPREVEEAYLAGQVAKYMEWEQRYTPLAGTATVEDSKGGALSVVPPGFMPTGFEKLVEHGFGPEKRVERVPVADLRDAAAQYRRLVVLGEPGSGKTTTMWRLVYDCASAAVSDPKAPIPVLVALGGYTGSESALAYCAQFADELELHLPAYLAKGRLILLLDAMNEMPRDGYTERVGRIQALIEGFPKSPVIVTCRALDYSEELKLEKVDVRPLDVFRQRDYLHRYLGEAGGDKLFWQLVGGDAAAGLWDAWRRLEMTFEQLWTVKELPDEVRWDLTYPQRDAWEALHRDGLPPLLALGVNPFLLVMLAQVYASRGELPQNRGKLFAAFVDTLLERERQRHQDGWLGAEVLIAAYSVLAFAMQQSGQRGTAVERDWAVKQLRDGGLDPEQVMYLGASATLLDTSGGQVRFVHQLIQEYFAAVAWQAHIEQGDDLRQYWPEGWVTPSGWEETAVLLAGLLPDMTPFVESLVEVHPPLTARCIAESGGVRPGSKTIGGVQTALAAIATSLAAPVKERNAAGNALNYVGDPRDGVGVQDGVPDIVWCDVPAGEFLMGNTEATDAMAYADEGPQHVVKLAAFAISKYSVTNAQYQAFVDDGGYTEKECWTQAGWEWKEERGRHGPARYGGDFDLANHPVVGVSWYEAGAFCNWLTKKLGRPIMLPSEAQWEKAARGTDGRRYPWGPEITPEHANYGDEGIMATSTVGVFPKGLSPFGILDASGNVWEWTTTKWVGNYEHYKPDDRLEGDAVRTLRGGAWNANVNIVRCARRYGDRPRFRNYDVGFRVLSPGF